MRNQFANALSLFAVAVVLQACGHDESPGVPSEARELNHALEELALILPSINEKVERLAERR